MTRAREGEKRCFFLHIICNKARSLRSHFACSRVCYGRWSREVFLDWRAADVAVPLLSLSDIRDWRLRHLYVLCV